MMDFSQSFTGLLYFWADWCSDCKRFTPILSAIEERFKQQIPLTKINIAEDPSFAEEFTVMSIPTLILVKEGKEVYRFVEEYKKDEILAEISAQFSK